VFPYIIVGMIKNIILSSIALFVGILLFGADIVYAQERLVPCTGVDCDFCHLVELSTNIINFFVYLAVAGATLMFMWAGILYVTSGPNPDNIGKAHKIFFNVLIGLIVVLGSWMIVNTILYAVVSDSAEKKGIAPWVQVLCTGTPRSIAGTGPDPGTGPVVATPGSDYVLSPVDGVREANQRSYFRERGVDVNRPPCRTSSSRDCTDVRDFNRETRQYAIDLAAACGCRVMITGGTEAGHMSGLQSHETGYKVDFRSREPDGSNSALTNWLNAGNLFFSNGIVRRENDHYDICVNCSSSESSSETQGGSGATVPN